MTRRISRVAVLFSRLSGYMASCLRTLHEQHGVELYVYRRPPAQEAPFEARHFEWIAELHDRAASDAAGMQAALEQFSPDAVLMSGWMDDDYLQVARAMRRRGVPVIAGSDAQWRGSMRQRVGQAIAPWHLHRAIDVLWVAGERQRQFARRLGYTGSRCWSGIYACDWERFGSRYVPDQLRSPRSFLFVGRYVPVKGLDVLLEAYRSYRGRVAAPWALWCAGAGEQQALLEGVEGVVDRGFVQPDELPALFGQASAFVLPSRHEPWGVVIQEAAAAGLPLICSDACGAAVHLLQDGYNGYVFAAGDAHHLADQMVALTTVSNASLAAMGRASHELSQQFTPQRWAETLVRGVNLLQLRRR